MPKSTNATPASGKRRLIGSGSKHCHFNLKQRDDTAAVLVVGALAGLVYSVV